MWLKAGVAEGFGRSVGLRESCPRLARGVQSTKVPPASETLVCRGGEGRAQECL